MKNYLFIALTFSLFSSVTAHAFGQKPINPDPAPAPAPSPAPAPEAGCPAPGAAQAVDLSMPINQHFLDTMKKIQVHTIIRYYDQVNETIDGKTLRADEVDLLARNGFDLLVVFQHNNNQISSFTAARGNSDAHRSLDLAATFNQTKGSAIYFGVDGDWSSSTELASIQTYFRTLGPLVRGAGFKVGAYGSGSVCTLLLKNGLADYCWLANAKGWPGYTDFYNSKNWTMVQSLPKDCGGLNGDFDVMNSSKRDIGQFRP